MTILDLSKIESTLNDKYKDLPSRKIVFWYDSKGEFQDDIDSLKLDNAKLLILGENNLFETKYILEIEDTTSNYLVYAPFPRSKNQDNHLADTILYSDIFVADRLSLIMVELNIDEEFRFLLEKHSKFFNSKERFNKFKELEIDKYDEESIELGFLAVLTGTKVVNFESILKNIIQEDVERNKFLEEFAKFDLLNIFWKYCNLEYGYISKEPTLPKFIVGLFVTYTGRKTEIESFVNKEEFLFEKPSNVVAFSTSLMNDGRTSDRFRELSEYVYSGEQIKFKELFKKIDIEKLLELDIFKDVENKFINWITSRLIEEHFDSKVGKYNIVELIDLRVEKFFGKDFAADYKMLKSAYYLLSFKKPSSTLSLVEMAKEYDNSLYLQDYNYRKFHYYFDKSSQNNEFEILKERAENYYINNYLDPCNIDFNEIFNYDDLEDKISLQRDFYKDNIYYNKHRSVVIISDALRYEVGKELVEKMNMDKDLEGSIKPQISTIPSITKLGMAALLPHKELEIDSSENYNVLVDGKKASTAVERESILKSYKENSKAIQFDKLISLSKDELREFFKDQEVIYIYHNQIDARGDEASTENEVFNACSEAINEIIELVKKLSGNVSIHNYIVTSDHGFIYTVSENSEADKIDKFYNSGDIVNRRYIISENEYNEIGVKSIKLADVLNNNDSRYVYFPNTSKVFKAKGGGQNYYHGGCSLQESITPIINIKSIRGKVETKDVEVELMNFSNNINSLSTSIELLQKEAISDIVKAREFEIYFKDNGNNIISNILNYNANSEDKNTGGRISRLSFSLKENSYDHNEKYYLVIKDRETGFEDSREVKIDIPFANDFGFNI